MVRKRRTELKKRNNINRLLVFTVLSLFFLGLFMPLGTEAHSLSPYVKDYIVYAGDKIDDSFNFTNTSEEDLDFNITVSAYNPQDGTFIDDELFITPIKESIRVAAGDSVQIKYRIEVPFFHTEGSYFNIIVVEEDLPLNDNAVGFKAGFGMTAGIHIVEENGSIKGAFDSLSSIFLSLKEKGLPYISPTVIKYTYQNNSSFVFLPSGEIRIFDTKTNERLLKDRLNEEELKIFPEDTYETSFSFNIWDYKNLFHDLKIVTRTYNQFDNNYIETVAIIPGFSETPFIIGGLVLAVVIITVVKVIKKKKKSKKSKASIENK